MTSTDLTHHRPTGALAITEEQTEFTPTQRAALAQIGVEDASDGDLQVFLTYAQRTGLDPWTRQLYMIGRNAKLKDANGREYWGQKYTIQASIDGLRIVAQRSGEYAGQVGPEWCGPDGVWRDVWLSDTPPSAARVGVLRRGWAQPQYAVAIFREYAGTTRDGSLTQMWREKPAVMIAKCAEALALRKAFPHDLSGIYTADEMSKADVVPSTVVPAQPATPAAPALDGDLVRAAILGARTKGLLLDNLVEVGAAHRDPNGAVTWPRRRDLEALRVADEHGQETSVWALIGAKGRSLPDVALAPEGGPDDVDALLAESSDVTDAELVDETTGVLL
jgi:phage recombination protein Bet